MNIKYFKFTGMVTSILGLTVISTFSVESNRNHPQSKVSIRFVVLADCRGNDHGINSVVVRKTLSRIKKLSPQPVFAVIPGDLVNGSKQKTHLVTQLEYFRKTVTEYYPLSFFHVGIGNHEVFCDEAERIVTGLFPATGSQPLNGYGHTVYLLDLGHTRLFMLNTNHPGEEHSISAFQLSWVKHYLDRSKKHNLFFMHEPSYPTGSHIGGSQDVDPDRRNELWNVIDSANGPMVFCGHEHFYSRRHIDNLYNETVDGKQFTYDKKVFQVTIGGFGGPLTARFDNKPGVDVPPIGQYHFAVVDASPDSIRVTVYNLDGAVLDRFSD